MLFRVSLIIFTIGSLSISLISQESDSVYSKKNILQRMDSITNWKIERGRSTLTPFIAPSYTPETSVMLTLGGLYTFKISPDNKLLSRSSIPFSIGYSTNGSLLISIRANIYGLSDKLRFTGEYWQKNMPDNYWGVGYEKGRYTPMLDSTTAYQRDWLQFKFKLAYEVHNNVFVGLNYDINRTVATEVNPVMAADSNYLLDGSEVFNKGLGIVLRYDSRDFPENAYKGLLIELAGANYGRFDQKSNDFRVYELDYRQFRPIKRDGRTIAWQVKSRISSGQVPWTDLSMIGTPFDLRGYTWGQFRDYSSVFILSEYRHMFERKTPNGRGDMYGPFGFTVWAGTGSIGQQVKNFTNWIPNAGVGFRFEIQKRMNLRIDYGLGLNSSAFYISFNEAF